MSITGEGVGTGEITEANFGEVLLYAYAGSMRQHAENKARASKFRSYAEQLEDRALATQQGIPLPEEGLPPEGHIIRLTEPISRAAAFRLIADRVEHEGGDTFATYGHDQYQNSHRVVGRTATITQIEERVDRNPPYRLQGKKSMTGRVIELSLGPTDSRITLGAKHLLDNDWMAGPLVDPEDFQANFTIQFHPR